MSQLVDSQALQRVSKTLQLSTPGAQETLFIDERLEQVVDVSPMIRRGLTLAGTEGLYSANVRTTHSGSQGNVSTSIDVYNLGGTARPPFPASIPDNLDLWLTGFSAENVSGPTFFDTGFLDMLITTEQQAFGTVTTNIQLGGWVTEKSFAGVALLVGQQSVGFGMFFGARIRIPRNAILRFHTRNNGANSPVYQLNLLLGLFPSSLGQDGWA